MRYTVPQFIEYEAKVVGPFTFGQFIFIAMAAASCFVLYFLLPLIVFLFATAIIMTIAFVFSLLKIGGRSITTILANFLKFNLGSKMYIWKKKEMPVMYTKSELKKGLEKKKEEVDEGLPLKIAEKSQLKRIRTKIEMKS
jgi:hypothetical protein